MDAPINERPLVRPEPPNQVVTINLRMEYVPLQLLLLNIVHRPNRCAFFPQRAAKSRIPETRIDPRGDKDDERQHQRRDLSVKRISYRRESSGARRGAIDEGSAEAELFQRVSNGREV